VIRALVGVAFAVLAACSVDHRSDQFACDADNPCPTGRVCDRGLCVDDGGPDASPTDVPDASPGTPDGERPDPCPPECTECNPDELTCLIDCGGDACGDDEPVVCPEGWNCFILCDDDNTCRDGVDCGAAASCTISCGGDGSCRQLDCGSGPCTVKCDGQNSCRGVECRFSCACDVTCDGPGACGESVACDFGCNDIFDGGCNADNFGCNTCGN
jgi:hypothetical protein